MKVLTGNEILSHFKGVKRDKPNAYRCLCPLHGDKAQSLTITFTRDRALFHCHAGCTETKADTGRLLEAVGLTWSDVGPEREKRDFSLRERLEHGLIKAHGPGKLTDIYDYRDTYGRYQYSKLRFVKDNGEKVTPFRCINYRDETYSVGLPDDAKRVLYNLPALIQAIRAGKTVYYCEGEKDCETLKKHGLVATTAGSASGFRPEFAKYFTGAKLVVIPDNDEPGQKCAETVMAYTHKYAYWRQITPVSDLPHGDVTDWLEKEGGSIKTLEGLVKDGEKYDTRQYAPWLVPIKTTAYEGPDGTIVSKPPEKNPEQYRKIVVVEKINMNLDELSYWFDKGNDYLLVRNPEDEKDSIYLYHGGVYVRANNNMLGSCFKRYMPLGTASANSITNSVKLLLNGNAEYRHICRYEHLDADENIINVRNGLYNLQTHTLTEHTPKQRSTIQLRCKYKRTEDENNPGTYKRPPSPVFDKFINDLCRDETGNVNGSKKLLMQEWTGVLLSNLNISRLKKMLILHSPNGNSGKSQYIGILSYMLDEKRVCNIPLQSMVESNRFALGSLKGRRLIAVGDQTGAEITDVALLKQLTGGDSVRQEEKGRMPEYAVFKGGIVIAANTLPVITGPDKGSHLFSRFCIIPIRNHIDDKTADVNILDKMKREADGIFAWALEGLERFLTNNKRFTPCQDAEDALDEFHNKSDTIYRYIVENGYKITGDIKDRIQRLSFDIGYLNWCVQNGIEHPVNKANIKNRMISLGCTYNGSMRIDGRDSQSGYAGIKKVDTQKEIKEQKRGFVPVNDPDYAQGELSLPFTDPDPYEDYDRELDANWIFDENDSDDDDSNF